MSAMVKPTRTMKIGEVTAIPYCCPNCGAFVGDFVHVNGCVRLDAGGWLIGDGMRHCHRCGRPIHFKAPKEPWEVLVKRYLERLAIANQALAAGEMGA